MENLKFYISALVLAGFLYACGGNQRKQMDEPVGNEMTPFDEGLSPDDSMRIDSVDTVERRVPTPPLN